MYVKKLDVDLVEDQTEEVVETASRIREMEEELEDVMEAIERNHKDFKVGKISLAAYRMNERKFSGDKNKLSKTIKQTVRECLISLDTVKKAAAPHLVLKANGSYRASKIKGR